MHIQTGRIFFLNNSHLAGNEYLWRGVDEDDDLCISHTFSRAASLYGLDVDVSTKNSHCLSDD